MTTFFTEENKATKDAFLMELKRNNGNVKVLDIFGLYEDIDNGALVPGNLDLHFTRDKHAVIMGNTKVPQDPNPASHPYLIERYRKIKKRCEDIRTKTEKFEYDFPMWEVKFDDMKSEASVLELDFKERRLKQDKVCDKVEPVSVI